MNQIAKFNIGEVVIHKKQGYRAVIVDADPVFFASGKMNPQVFKRAFAQKNPWYRLLVDESNLMTYVEEICLETAFPVVINNPNVYLYLKRKNGQYVASYLTH